MFKKDFILFLYFLLKCLCKNVFLFLFIFELFFFVFFVVVVIKVLYLYVLKLIWCDFVIMDFFVCVLMLLFSMEWFLFFEEVVVFGCMMYE